MNVDVYDAIMLTASLMYSLRCIKKRIYLMPGGVLRVAINRFREIDTYTSPELCGSQAAMRRCKVTFRDDFTIECTAE